MTSPSRTPSRKDPLPKGATWRLFVGAASAVRWVARQAANTLPAIPPVAGSSRPIDLPSEPFSLAELPRVFREARPRRFSHVSQIVDLSQFPSLQDLRGFSKYGALSPHTHLRADRTNGRSTDPSRADELLSAIAVLAANTGIDLGTFLDRLPSEAAYPFQVVLDLPAAPRELPADVEGRLQLPAASGLFVGGRGHVTLLHYDAWHGLFFQLAGTKAFTLCPPESSRYLYVQPPLAMTVPQGCTRLTEPLPDVDAALYPLLSRACYYAAVLSPGDALYIPPFWWHEVRCTTPAIGGAVRYFPNGREASSSSLFPMALYWARARLRQRKASSADRP